jgi:ABC-type lipoprotein release transport system permease subunit
MLMLKLAWRNSLRNKRRTFLAALAIGIGLAGLIFADAIYVGMTENMIKTATSTFMGDGQITHKDFRDTFDAKNTIKDISVIRKKLQSEHIVKAFSQRVASFAMISSAANSDSVILYGIDPKSEKKTSKIYQAVSKGNYLSAGNPYSIIIGSKLAEKLELELGDRIVITTSETKGGQISQAMFMLEGIYKFGSREMDSTFAFVNLKQAQNLLKLGDNINEIAIKFTSIRTAENKNLPFWKEYSQNTNLAQGWDEIFSELKNVIKMTDFSMLIVGAILFGIVALSIINTLFMALYERMFEFGVMRALGTRPLKMAMMIISEACMLAIISIIMGALIAFGVSYFFSLRGLDYTGIEFSGVTLLEPIYTVITWKQYLKYPLWVFLFAALAGIYPAVYASRIVPVKALKKTL